MGRDITMTRRDFLQLVGGAAAFAAWPSGCATTGKGQRVKLEKLAMPPFNTTLMGVVKGALDYHGNEVTAPAVFGASGPYCWNREAASPLLRNLGLEMTDLGFFSPRSSPKYRAAVERHLRDALDNGTPCSLVNLENQLIAGYDDDGFLVLQPWAPKVDFPPARLTFGSWKELGDVFHVNFSRDYGVGPDAYANWIDAAAKFGASHGNWWNATVWSECRQMASQYFGEIQRRYGDVAQAASELTGIYADIAGALGRLSDKKMAAAEKVSLLAETRDKEAAAITKVAALAASLRLASA